MWEVSLDTQQSIFLINKVLAKKIKPELAQYFHVTLFI